MNNHDLDTSDFELDEIVSIDLIGDAETVDITVEDVHMFFANDVYSHNSAIDMEVIEADKIADSYAKVMNADFIMSWSRKSKDKLNNTARVHVMKNRFGMDGITFPCKMDTNQGIIQVYESGSPDGIIATKESANGSLVEKQLLHKKYVENMGIFIGFLNIYMKWDILFPFLTNMI